MSKIIFIVGNSRSGTTMMGRVLGNHPDIFTFNELHFFEQLWIPGDKTKLDLSEAVKLFAELLSVQRDGYLQKKKSFKYLAEARAILEKETGQIHPVEVYEKFLFYEARMHGKTIPCEQTPRNLFYLKEVLDYFTKAKILYMVRDPRDVLLSQKKRWKRAWFRRGHGYMMHLIRDFFNYHPWTISRLWMSSEKMFGKVSGANLKKIRFEDFINLPVNMLKEICEFAEISYSSGMLNVPRAGSSLQRDDNLSFGIDSSRAGNWSGGGLSKTEIFICEVISQSRMIKDGYVISKPRPNVFLIVFYCLYFPAHLVFALLMNIKRAKSLIGTIARRF